jgi:arylsulfatase A-like enzyme
MTGVYPHTHGICSNVHNLGCSVHELIDRPELLSRRLGSVGYECGYSGKWHLGEDKAKDFQVPNTPSLPGDVGFKGQNFPGHGGGGFKYPEYKEYLKKHGFEHEVIPRDDRDVRVMPYGLLKGPEESTVASFITEHTLGMIDEFSKGTNPFFIWHNFWGPHSPYYVPQNFYDMYKDVEIPEWPNFRWDGSSANLPMQVKRHPCADKLTWDDWTEGVRHYYAFTTLIDRQIGRLMNGLQEKGLLDNTIVIFTADHGETLGSHGGLTDKGWHHFEEIQRIPFIVRLPPEYRGAGVKPGAVLEQWVSLADVYPTVLDAAGARCGKADSHGTSLLPLLKDPKTPWRDRVCVEFNGVNGLATSMISIRKGRFKYGWNCSSRDELYDLEADPNETVNRIDDPGCSEKLRELREDMAEWMKETGYDGRARNMFRQSRLGENTA